eukprot:scaffold7048_cov132-Chaetoceros_neogracile.AAC.2
MAGWDSKSGHAGTNVFSGDHLWKREFCRSTSIHTAFYRSLEHRSDIAILDAATLEILCLMELQHHVPYQFHGDFVDFYIANDA